MCVTLCFSRVGKQHHHQKDKKEDIRRQSMVVPRPQAVSHGSGNDAGKEAESPGGRWQSAAINPSGAAVNITQHCISHGAGKWPQGELSFFCPCETIARRGERGKWRASARHRRWLQRPPHPFTAAENRAGPPRAALYQRVGPRGAVGPGPGSARTPSRVPSNHRRRLRSNRRRSMTSHCSASLTFRGVCRCVALQWRHSIATQRRGRLLRAAMDAPARSWPPSVGDYAERQGLFRLLQVNGSGEGPGGPGFPHSLRRRRESGHV